MTAMAGKLQWAPDVYRRLNGIISCYKPPHMSVSKMVDIIKFNLSRDLNAMPCYKTERTSHRGMSATHGESKGIEKALIVTTSDLPDLTEHRLVLGPRYQPSDFRIHTVNWLSKHSSGVQVLGLGQGCGLIHHLSVARHLRVYHVSGRFGYATDTFTPAGKIRERTTFHHITKPRLDKICSAIAASYRKHVFSYAGVMDNSEEAYALASQGIPRPLSSHTPPLLYSVRCIDFSLPDFTLEIHSINEKDAHFLSVVNDLGLELKSTAVCTKVRRLRLGPFTAEDSLLHKHWKLEHILQALQHTQSSVSLATLAPGASVTELEGDVRHLAAGDGQNLVDST